MQSKADVIEIDQLKLDLSDQFNGMRNPDVEAYLSKPHRMAFGNFLSFECSEYHFHTSYATNRLFQEGME